jgi:hypothetical protein
MARIWNFVYNYNYSIIFVHTLNVYSISWPALLTHEKRRKKPDLPLSQLLEASLLVGPELHALARSESFHLAQHLHQPHSQQIKIKEI